MEYIMTALGIVVIMGFVIIALMLAPIIFNLFVIGVDEFMKLCSWLRYRVKTRDVKSKHEVTISQTEYDMLIETFNMFYEEDILKEAKEILESEGEELTDEEWKMVNSYSPKDEMIGDMDMTQTYEYDPKLFDDALKETSEDEEIPLY